MVVIYGCFSCDLCFLGVMNGPLKFLTARKILPLLDCSQNLKEYSLAHALKIFAVARKLAFLSVLLEIL